jgi:NAD(P)H dehydrogenase (quinone)
VPTLPSLAVTGSTGALGGLVARALADRGVPQRLVVRSLERAPRLPLAVAVTASYDDRDAALSALSGVRTLLMVSGSESADRLEQHRTFVDAAVSAGVEHVVYTSFFGASPACTFTLGRDHWATEQHLRVSGTQWTFLRDNFYLDFLPLMVGEDGVIRGPADEGRVSAVSRADIARVATAVLLDPQSHRGATYNLTGPEGLTLAEAAATIREVTGRAVTFHDETVEEAYESRRKWDAPQWQYDAWVSTYTAIAAGEVEAVTDDVRRVTGQAPMGLRDLLSSRQA